MYRIPVRLAAGVVLEQIYIFACSKDSERNMSRQARISTRVGATEASTNPP